MPSFDYRLTCYSCMLAHLLYICLVNLCVFFCLIIDESVGKLLTSSQVGHTIPASAYELFPLALKMLSHSKMWVVHLGKAAVRSNVPLELRSCRSFALLEDLKKLLHGLCPRRGATWLRSWLGGGKQENSDKALDKLKTVVQQLEQWERFRASKEERLEIVTV